MRLQFAVAICHTAAVELLTTVLPFLGLSLSCTPPGTPAGCLPAQSCQLACQPATFCAQPELMGLRLPASLDSLVVSHCSSRHTS